MNRKSATQDHSSGDLIVFFRDLIGLLNQKITGWWWFQPLWKIWARQLGWWNSQYIEIYICMYIYIYGKIIQMFQSTNQISMEPIIWWDMDGHRAILPVGSWGSARPLPISTSIPISAVRECQTQGTKKPGWFIRGVNLKKVTSCYSNGTPNQAAQGFKNQGELTLQRNNAAIAGSCCNEEAGIPQLIAIEWNGVPYFLINPGLAVLQSWRWVLNHHEAIQSMSCNVVPWANHM